jgi:hypothetical protein
MASVSQALRLIPWMRQERKPHVPKHLQFEVRLIGIKPRIWRRFQLAANATFQHLHNAIQDAFGDTVAPDRERDHPLGGFGLMDRARRRI